MSNIIDKWAEIKVLIESIDLDVHKNAGGNASAGVRARKGLRMLKKEAADLVWQADEHLAVRNSKPKGCSVKAKAKMSVKGEARAGDHFDWAHRQGHG